MLNIKSWETEIEEDFFLLKSKRRHFDRKRFPPLLGSFSLNDGHFPSGGLLRSSVAIWVHRQRENVERDFLTFEECIYWSESGNIQLICMKNDWREGIFLIEPWICYFLCLCVWCNLGDRLENLGPNSSVVKFGQRRYPETHILTIAREGFIVVNSFGVAGQSVVFGPEDDDESLKIGVGHFLVFVSLSSKGWWRGGGAVVCLRLEMAYSAGFEWSCMSTLIFQQGELKGGEIGKGNWCHGHGVSQPDWR